ncbi:MAG: sensor histidine kinase [Salinibacter sp.]|uniref:sensor histidine kinase n=1 Tax=Salinibacter sp. TaxID=2065818 RepID=UPI0035D47B61
MRTVVQHLVSNVIKYTEEGGPVWGRIRREDAQTGPEVEDTGIGIEPGAVDRLFGPFRQTSGDRAEA